MAKSPRFRQVAAQVSAAESPVILLEISHALLAEPMRFVGDNQDLLSNGHNYRAAAFGFVWPDDADKQTPVAQLAIGNFSSGVSDFFERTHGGRGALITVRQVMRSVPDFYEDELVLNLGDIQVNTQSVSGRIGYEDVLNRVGTPRTHRPENSPGLF